jgi:hypothetical protein
MVMVGEYRRTRRETCPTATLSAINPTCTKAGANPGFRGERPGTNLSHGTTMKRFQFPDNPRQ